MICDVLWEMKYIEDVNVENQVQMHLTFDVNVFRCTPFPREHHILYRIKVLLETLSSKIRYEIYDDPREKDILEDVDV